MSAYVHGSLGVTTTVNSGGVLSSSAFVFPAVYQDVRALTD